MMMNASGLKEDPTLPGFGVIQLALRSPSPVEPDITMKISSEATLPDMLRFFETFLRSAGYVLDAGDTLIVQPAKDECRHQTLPDPAGNYIESVDCMAGDHWNKDYLTSVNTPIWQTPHLITKDFTQGANGSTESLVY